MSDFTSKCHLARRSPKLSSEKKVVSKEVLLLKPRLSNEYERNDDDKNNTFKVSLNLRPAKQELRLKDTNKPKVITKELLERRPVSPISSSSGYESELHDSDSDSCASYFQEMAVKRESSLFCEQCFTLAVHSRLASQLPLPRTNEAGLWSTHSETDRFGRVTCPRLLELYNCHDADMHRARYDRLNPSYNHTHNYGKFYGF